MPFGKYPTDYSRLEQFVRDHMLEFSKFALYVVHDREAAEDGLQNAFEAIMKYYDNIRDFDDDRLFRYCLSIIKHECVRAACTNQEIVSTEDIVITDSIPDEMLDDIIKDADNAVLRACIEELPEKFRLAILLKYYYDWKDTDIGKAIDISDNSVRMILTRGRQKLKALYIKHSGEEEA